MLATTRLFSYSGLAAHSCSRIIFCWRFSCSARSCGLAHIFVPDVGVSKSAASSTIFVRFALFAWKDSNLSLCACAALSFSVSESEVAGDGESAGLLVCDDKNAAPVMWRGLLEATSARLCAALLASIFSRPRSSRKIRTMDWMSDCERSGFSQKEQGPSPSLTQIILPQLRQLGAASRSGCRVAMQLQRRLAFSSGVRPEREGFVWISSARMAESRSLSTVD
ncbi:hypothetical protein MPH_04708 [Macrophomina phaseolina MS6]|uniref:Uncharacterized protein n=1 Tax=Macrophomina phaseolina (strain MS6) TaxID=1126212 RepID=K2RTF1_MACPH|nr:hypothetical protein MPH_04708 [Macrophomina phaseolina MS6]